MTMNDLQIAEDAFGELEDLKDKLSEATSARESAERDLQQAASDKARLQKQLEQDAQSSSAALQKHRKQADADLAAIISKVRV